MTRGRKIITVVSAVALAAGVALSGAQAASAATPYDSNIPVVFNLKYNKTATHTTGMFKIGDRSGGFNVSVAVNNLRIQKKVGSKWTTVGTSQDADGWHDKSDTAQKTVRCATASSDAYRMIGYTQWKGQRSGKGNLMTTTWYC